MLCMLALFAVQSAQTCCKRPKSSQYVLSEIEKDARLSESQSTRNASYDLCSIFLQRFKMFQGVRDSVQLIVEGVWLVESQLEWWVSCICHTRMPHTSLTCTFEGLMHAHMCSRAHHTCMCPWIQPMCISRGSMFNTWGHVVKHVSV